MSTTSKLTVLAMAGSMAFFVGCASKPEQAVTAAQEQLNQAKATEAETYAGDLYQQGQEQLNAAQAEIKVQDEKFALSRDYSKAESLLAESKATFEKAAAEAGVNKEAARVQATAAFTQAETALANAEAALNSAPKGKDTQADLEAMKGDLQAAKDALIEARKAFDGSKYSDANTQLKAVISAAQDIQTDVEQAKAKTGRRS